MSGGVGEGVTVSADVGGGLANAVKEGVEKLAEVGARVVGYPVFRDNPAGIPLRGFFFQAKI